MPTLVTVRKWGSSLGLVLPKSFASQRVIMDGTTVEIDNLRVVAAPAGRRRSRYKLKDVLKNYAKPPKELNFTPAGREMA
jgi:antitoxin component of MazEF toxin-antitoxin module